MFTLKQKINKASGGGRLVLASIFGLSVAFTSDLGALYTDYYQGLAARNQLLNFNDDIINRQYRIERKCAEADVVNTKDSRAFVILNGGYHEFDKGGNKIYDKSNNLGFILGYEKSCNENLTLGVFAGYSNTDCEQDGNFYRSYKNEDGEQTQEDLVARANGNVRSGVFGVFGRYSKERLVISGVLSGSWSHYDIEEHREGTETIEGEDGTETEKPTTWSQNNSRNGYSICGTIDARYNFSKNEKFSFGPLVALSYCYVEQDAYLFFLNNNFNDNCNGHSVRPQFGKTLLGEAGVYGTYDCCVRNIPVRLYGSAMLTGIMKKPDSEVVYYAHPDDNSIKKCATYRTREPSSYINVRLGVTSAVSESIDLNADVKGSFAKDYYDVMGAVGMSYNF